MGLLTSRSITVSELDESGQPTQKQRTRVDYGRRMLRALCNKAISTIVIRTSAAAIGVSIGEVESIHRDSGTCQCKESCCDRLDGDS